MTLEKQAATSVPIHELMTKRWSPRAYDAGRPVTRAQLAALLEAARWAPSCNGVEPWRYLVWDRFRDPEGFQRAFECLSEGNKRWAKNAPLLMLAVASADTLPGGRPNRFSQHDTGMATLSLALQAVALGLVAHQMGGFDAEKARAAFGIPADCTALSMIAVGYQASPDTLDDETRSKELAPRSRRPLAERFFEGRWGNGFRL
jgi:nitroreductase